MLDRITHAVVGVVSGESAPDESAEYLVVAHDSARFKQDRVNPDTLEVSPYVHINSDSQNREQFKAQRKSTLAKSSIILDGMEFDSDEESQSRLLRPIALLQNDVDTQLWVLKDNTTVLLNRPQFLAVLDLAVKQQTKLWVQL